jgi:hypothetical protein
MTFMFIPWKGGRVVKVGINAHENSHTDKMTRGRRRRVDCGRIMTVDYYTFTRCYPESSRAIRQNVKLKWWSMMTALMVDEDGEVVDVNCKWTIVMDVNRR